MWMYAEGGALEGGGTSRSSAISPEGLAHFRSGLGWAEMTAEELFYYIYGVLHHEGYRERYANNFGKEVPRIPLAATRAGAEELSRLGKRLGDMHVDYETEDYDLITRDGGVRLVKPNTQEDLDVPKGEADLKVFYQATKIKELKVLLTDGSNKKVQDKTRILYNDHIEVRDIPSAAWDYEVNGKAALKWVMERQGIKIDKDSNILSDANAYATETAGDVAYPLKLLLRVISISLRTRTGIDACNKVDLQ